MKRKFYFIGLVLAALLASLSVWKALNRPTRKPAATVTFIGFSNAPLGTKLGCFAISNAGPSSIVLESHYRVQVKAGARWKQVSEGWLSTGGFTLSERASGTLTLDAPTNQTPWRIVFSAGQDEGMFFSMATELLIEGQKLGLPTRYTRKRHPLFSNPVQN